MDIILTGIARSGTTLSCSLLNKLPQCVALHEPMDPEDLVGLGFPEAYMARIASFFAAQRASLLGSGTAVSKARDGRVGLVQRRLVIGNRLGWCVICAHRCGVSPGHGWPKPRVDPGYEEGRP